MVSQWLTINEHPGALVVTMANLPSNALLPSLRADLIAALVAVGPGCGRIVLAGSGATFSSALPLDPDPAEPRLAELCTAIEQSPVPVIAALHGLVMGPGAELALAARRRIVAPGTRIAFSEVALGLCPEAGTTRRLTRLVGTGAALRLLLSGRAVAAEEALALGLVDAIAESPSSAALVMQTAVGPPGMVPAADPVAIAEARRIHARALPAVGRIIGCVEAAALLPVEAHQAFEAVAREDLEAGPEAAALRSVARAERRTTALPAGLARLRTPAPDRIALHGASPDLVTLARIALACGLQVVWEHPGPAAAAASLAALEAAEATEQRAGRLSGAARAAGRARLEASGPAPVHIHADPGNLARPDGPDDPVRIVLGGGEAAFGLVLAPSGAGCELAMPSDAAPAALSLALATLRRLGLQPVLVGQRPLLGIGLATAGRTALARMAALGVPKPRISAALEGFGARHSDLMPEPQTAGQAQGTAEILGRWLGALANEGFRLLDQGIARRPSDIDHVLVAGHGFPRWQGGPMHLAERRGLMALRHDLRRWAEDDPLWAPAPMLDRLLRDGQRLRDLDDRV